MFKKITYVISIILGIFFVSKLFKNEVPSFNSVGTKEGTPVKKEEVVKRVNTKNLNSRQKEILKLMNKRQVLLPSDIYALHPNVSTRTLRRDMTSLTQLGIVKQEGSTRDTKYILNT